MSNVYEGDFKNKTASKPEECSVIDHLHGKQSIIAIAAATAEDEYEFFVSDDLNRFDIIALLSLAKLKVELGEVEEGGE